MTSYTGAYDQGAETGIGLAVQNSSNNRTRDTDIVVMDGTVCSEPLRQQHFDWCILSVLGFILFYPIGLCAMYYAMRANHGKDHNIEEPKIHAANTKAMVLTLLSVAVGGLWVIIMVIVLVS